MFLGVCTFFNGVRVNSTFVSQMSMHNIYKLSSSGPGPGPRSGPGQVPGQVQKVQGLRTKDLDLG